LSERFDTTAEQIRQNYVATVAQMRCPYHHKCASVEIEDERYNTCYIDVLACCEEFERRVRDKLMDPRSEETSSMPRKT